MPIQFPQLLQDSWNFMRNQLSFTLTAMGVLLLLQLMTLYAIPRVHLDPAALQGGDLEKVLTNSSLSMTLLLAAIGVFINILLILNIKSINNGRYHHFFQHLGEAFKVLFPIIGLSILSAIPLSLGMTAGLVGLTAEGQASGLLIVALPLMLSGIFFFVKWCLAVYVYLIEEPQKGVFETLSFTWKMSRGRMVALFLFCLLSYLLPTLIGNMIGRIGGELGTVLSLLVSVFLSVFVVVFSFRFYQVYRQH